jgi:hypothetical protein
VTTFVCEHRDLAAVQVSLQTHLVTETSVSEGQVITALLHEAADHDGRWTVDPIRHGAAGGLHPDQFFPER